MSTTSTAKTLAKGLSKTRSGSPSISIHSLINKGFADRIKKAVSEDEALEAAKTLTHKSKGRLGRYTEGAALGALANPVLRAAGRGVEAAVGGSKGMGGWRAGLARAAVKNTSRGEFARHLTEGALAGGGVQAIREGVELGKAKKTVKKFVHERTHKSAGVEPAPQSRGLPRRKPSDPWRYDPRPAGEL